MEDIESPSTPGPVAAPKNLSRNALVTWGLGILAACCSFLFGQNSSLQADKVEMLKDQVKKAEDISTKLDTRLEDALKQLRSCEAEKNNLRGQYNITAGRKKLVITPSEDGQISDYEN